MKIAVLSPAHKQGGTCLSALLACAFAQTQDKSVCLTYTGTNKELSQYLGLSSEYVDKTRTASQIAELLKVNAIKPDNLADYCEKVGENLDLLKTEINYYDSVDSSRLMEFLVGSLSHDIVITDVTTDIYDDVTQRVIDKSDMIMLVTTQDYRVDDKLKAWMESKHFEAIKKKGALLVVNKFTPVVGNLKHYNKMGFKNNRMGKLHYNPYIIRMANDGKLYDIMKFIVNKDGRVIELNQDIKEILQVICANAGFKPKWQDKIETKKK